jgi:hypothetical protein
MAGILRLRRKVRAFARDDSARTENGLLSDDDDTGLKTVSLRMKIRERKFAGDCVAAGLASELSVFQGG